MLQAGGLSVEQALAMAEASPALQAQLEPAFAAFLDAHADHIALHRQLPGVADPAAVLRARLLAGRCGPCCPSAAALVLVHVQPACAALNLHPHPIAQLPGR